MHLLRCELSLPLPASFYATHDGISAIAEYTIARYLDKQTPMMSIPRYFPTHFTPSCKVLQLNPLLLMAEILTEKAKACTTVYSRASPSHEDFPRIDLGRYSKCRTIVIVPFLMQVMSGLIVIENVLAWPNVNALIIKALPLPAQTTLQSPLHLRACLL